MGYYEDLINEKKNHSHAELVKIAKDFYFYDKWTKKHISDSFKRTQPGITDSEIEKIFDEAGINNSKKEKYNAYAKLVKKTPNFDIYEDFEGYFMRVKDGKVIKGGYLSVEDAERDGHRAKYIGNSEEKGYYEKLVEEKNSNPYYIALSLIKDKHSINDMIRELTSNYGATKAEALKAIEKAAKDLHDAEVESKVRSLY